MMQLSYYQLFSTFAGSGRSRRSTSLDSVSQLCY